MSEPFAAGPARAMLSLESISSAIAGFALFAGSRPFTFAALVSLRAPVLGSAVLVLLALVGWVQWRFRASAASDDCGSRRLLVRAQQSL